MNRVQNSHQALVGLIVSLLVLTAGSAPAKAASRTDLGGRTGSPQAVQKGVIKQQLPAVAPKALPKVTKPSAPSSGPARLKTYKATTPNAVSPRGVTDPTKPVRGMGVSPGAKQVLVPPMKKIGGIPAPGAEGKVNKARGMQKVAPAELPSPATPKSFFDLPKEGTGAVGAEERGIIIVGGKPGEGQGEDTVPAEELKLNYKEIKQDYQGVGSGKGEGNVEHQWKVEEGTK